MLDPALWITSRPLAFGGRISPYLKNPARRPEPPACRNALWRKAFGGARFVGPGPVSLHAVHAKGGGGGSRAQKRNHLDERILATLFRTAGA